MARTAFTRIGSTSLALSDVDFDRAMQGQDSNIVAQFNKVQSKVRHQLRKSAAVIDYLKALIVQATRRTHNFTAKKEAFFAVFYNVAYSNTGDKAQATAIAAKQLSAIAGDKVSTKELCDIAVMIKKHYPAADVNDLTAALDMEGQSIAAFSYMTLGSMVMAYRLGSIDKFIQSINWVQFFECHKLHGDRFTLANERVAKHFIDTFLSIETWANKMTILCASEGIYGDLME